ncbi:hypothetical protein GH714_014500 [Hevea brasiliensis]|uniref:Uncharacterized protein n=1 Tax=Hevea brasiliensis TaxID=3981 RepID=A0A6A6KLB6_HEVBR|nr:hypothetical protein GH714_014500 [Hevea brasiliensis]
MAYSGDSNTQLLFSETSYRGHKVEVNPEVTGPSSPLIGGVINPITITKVPSIWEMRAPSDAALGEILARCALGDAL